jgi:hypothetical protein
MHSRRDWDVSEGDIPERFATARSIHSDHMGEDLDTDEAKYEAALREWAALTEAGSTAVERNGQVERRQRAYLRIRATPSGRAVVGRLSRDANPRIRAWAATDLLGWDPEAGRVILTALRESGGPGSLEARVTLMELERGKLRLDWDPDVPIPGDIPGH